MSSLFLTAEMPCRFVQLDHWCTKAQSSSIVAVEIGAGTAVPTESASCSVAGIHTVRINPREFEASIRPISIPLNDLDAIKKMDRAISILQLNFFAPDFVDPIEIVTATTLKSCRFRFSCKGTDEWSSYYAQDKRFAVCIDFSFCTGNVFHCSRSGGSTNVCWSQDFLCVKSSC